MEADWKESAVEKISVTIAVRGAVQGIGYRPFAAGLAEQYHLEGTVRNSGGIVLLEVTGERSRIDLLEDALRTKTPPGGLVVSVTEFPHPLAEEKLESPDDAGLSNRSIRHVCQQTCRRTHGEHTADAFGKTAFADFASAREENETGGHGFRIVESSREESGELPTFPPDLGICPDCEREMLDPENRRFRYGLISCVSCGPRWSILDELPYDRERTAMRPFSMCPSCQKEYMGINDSETEAGGSAEDSGAPSAEEQRRKGKTGERQAAGRRRHAQTISCHDCGPQMYFVADRKELRERNRTHQLGNPEFGQKADPVLQGELDPQKRTYQEVRQAGSDPQRRIYQEECRMRQTGSDLQEKREKSRQVCRRVYGEEGFAQAVRVLTEGGILALKGVGGYQLLCSAFREDSVQRLRRMKGREEKPFAVLFSSVEAIEEYAEVSDREREALESSARPIVLLKKGARTEEKAADKKHGNVTGNELETAGGEEPKAAGGNSRVMAPSVCGESRYLGAFLPSFGVQELLLREAGPLVLTSANQSGEPIPFEEETFASMEFSGGEEPDGVYLHDRKIRRPLDDSVVFVEKETLQIIRRSRGYVPMPVFVPEEWEDAVQTFQSQDKTTEPLVLISADQSGESIAAEKAALQKKQSDAPVIFAAGGDLKAAFAFAKKDRIVLSQYLGDLSGYSVMCNYRAQKQQMEKILKAEPDCVVCDLHPGYFSSAMAKEYAEEKKIPLFRVQHHQAHAASVMAEHGLKSCLGIVFDGTGCGTDGQLWGGEFLYLCEDDFRRLGSLSDCRMLGGDALSVRADLSADCLLHQVGEQTQNPLVGELLSGAAPDRTILSTSMGRLFDAAASLLGFGRENRYEGECAILLEQAAWRALERREEKEDSEEKDQKEKNLTEKGPTEKDLKEKNAKENIETKRKKMLAESLLSFRNLVAVSPDGRLLLSQEALVRGILERSRKGKDPEETALFFHLAISYGAAQIAARLSERTGEKKICLSGGCFANRLLLSSLTALLKQKGLLVYWNEQVPCNDGGIALGQAYLGRFLAEKKV